MASLMIDTDSTSNEYQRKLEQLLAQQAQMQAQQAELQAQIACLTSSAPTSSNFSHHRSPIHKQSHQQRRSLSNVPRSMSSSGTTMARHLSSDRIEAPSRTRTLSQQSSHSMARTNSRGSTSARGTGQVPFTQTSTMPPPLLTDSRRENPVETWASQDQPFNPYAFSHQPQQMQRSMSQRKPELEQVPELDSLPGDNPADFFIRTGLSNNTPFLQLPPSPMTIQETQLRHRHSISSRQSFNSPTTPTSDSLTTATTLSTNMSRQNSLCNEPLIEGIQMMKFPSNNSFSTDFIPADHILYDQVTPFSSRHSRRSSNEEQSQLLVGAGGASHDSQFSHPFSAVEADAQFHASDSFGEKMEKSQSSESTSSSSSNLSSRSKQRLQAQISLAAARPLMPKGGSDDNAMSRNNSSQSMSRQSSNDGSQDKIAISKPNYVRPKHDRVHCKQCEDHPDGFRGEHELRRHQDRQHKLMVKKWICIQPTHSRPDMPKPVVPLHKCKACTSQKKKYGAYYNAAAHLRRAHFRPKAAKGRAAKSTKLDDSQKRGGKAGGDWPLMTDLKDWMQEVEETATEYPLSATQQQAIDDDEEEPFDFDKELTDTLNNTPNGSFDNSYTPSDASYTIYPSPANNDMFSIRNLQLDMSPSQQQSIDSSMNYSTSQANFDSFAISAFSNDDMSFMEHSSSLPPNIPHNSFHDQIIGLDSVNFPYL